MKTRVFLKISFCAFINEICEALWILLFSYYLGEIYISILYTKIIIKLQANHLFHFIKLSISSFKDDSRKTSFQYIHLMLKK